MAVVGPGPKIHPWMIAPHGPVAGSADQLNVVAERVDYAGRTLQTVLGEAGGILGWRSPGGEAARVPLVQADSEIGQLHGLLGRASHAVRALSAAMAQHGPPLKDLAARRHQLAQEHNAGQAGGVGGSAGAKDHTAEIYRMDGELQDHIDALARADRAARDELESITVLVAALGAANREDEWVADMAPPEIIELLGRYGVTESATERALLDKILFLPAGPAGDEELRALLATMTPDELADFLLRHPDVARRLAGPLGPPESHPPGSPEATLAAALAASSSLPPKERIAAIRAAWAGMSPEEQRKLALLYPGVVGNLDGAPLDIRMAANRVKIGIALDDERAKEHDHNRALAARTDREKWWGDTNNHEGWRYVKDIDDADSGSSRNDKRIDYYQKLLYEEVTQPGGGPAQLGEAYTGERDERSRNPNADYTPTVHYDQHQILYFDPTGDGQIAEMWGTIGPDTRNVAVFVPGTTADLENFGSDSEKMRRMTEMDPEGKTVAITWLGSNMPDAVAANATNAKYAEEGGPKLRDFVWGLDIPEDKRVTAIGHSYGGAVVGVADREGLEVDAVVHLESAGLGNGVRSPADYPDGVDGKERYAMTAPGDPIGYVQGQGLPGWLPGPDIGHGADPDEAPGVVRLDTGRYEEGYRDPDKVGKIIQGNSSHTDVARPGTTAFDNLYGVVSGGEVTVYTEPTTTQRKGPPGNPVYPWGNGSDTRYPYEDPDFEGPKHDIPDDAGR